jgi:hypothetical protein
MRRHTLSRASVPHHSLTRRVHARQAVDGQVLVIFALFSIVLLGALSLSVDAGYLMAQRRGAQNAVDAAALAADKAVQRHQFGDVQATGQDYVANNGFGAGAANTVTISYPPATGPKAGSAVCVEANVTHAVTRFFIGAIYTGPWQVTARAVACNEPVARSYAVMTLNPDGTGITSGGSSYLAIEAGGAYSAAGVDICGTASWLQAEGPLDAVSGLTICSNASVEAQTMNGSAPPTTDPLAGVPPPTSAECGATRADPNITNSAPPVINLPRGNYTHGITISGNDRVINFESGTYCFGQDLKTNGGAHGNLLKGHDVQFYFAGSAMFNVNGGGNNVQLDAGPGGVCVTAACNAQIVIFYDRLNCANLWLVGGNATHVDGIIYAPCSLAHLGGDSGSDLTGQVIVGDLTLNGGAHLTIVYQPYTTTTIPLVYLTE